MTDYKAIAPWAFIGVVILLVYLLSSRSSSTETTNVQYSTVSAETDPAAIQAYGQEQLAALDAGVASFGLLVGLEGLSQTNRTNITLSGIDAKTRRYEADKAAEIATRGFDTQDLIAQYQLQSNNRAATAAETIAKSNNKQKDHQGVFDLIGKGLSLIAGFI